ncbi:MAG: polysaccharide biosynthesis tyrosine autokinase [Chthoniobacteraceae bacterium]
MSKDSLNYGEAEAAEADPAQGTDWREYYVAVRERFWVVLLCLALGAIGAAIYASRQVPRFEARAVLFLEQEQDRVLKDVKGVREEQISTVDMINTKVDLLRSYSFAQRVSERLKLNEDPGFRAGIPAIGSRQLTSAEAAGALVGLVSAQYRKNTRLIDVSVSHPDPTIATMLANAFADEYVRYVFEKRSEASKAAQTYLLEEAERLRRKMRVSEEGMQSFRQRERAPSVENMQVEAQTKVTQLSGRMTEMEGKMEQLDADLKIARASSGKPEELLRLPSVAAEPQVARLTQAVAEREREILLLSQRYRAKHPAYLAARTQLDSLVAERNNVLRDSVTLLETFRKNFQSQYDEAKKSKEEHEARLLEITGKSVEFNDLKRELETDTAMYSSLLARIKEIDMTRGLTDSPVRIHERANGAAPLGASRPKIFLVGSLLGLAIGVGLVLGRHFLDQSVKSVEQVEQLSGLPVLAAIPKKRQGQGEAGAQSLDTVAERNGVVAEAFRSLRASLSTLAGSESRRSFLVTSALPSDGKTFCSANFAVSLAQQGFKTLLIDADLRKPTVARVLFGQHREPGLSDVLSSQIPLDEAVNPTPIENLFVLTSGVRAPNPAELLAGARFGEVLRDALHTFERVVIDSAPALAVGDAFLIAPYANVTVMVVRSFATPRKAVVRAIRALAEIKCRPVGIVLNCLPTGAGRDYYYSGKYYGEYSGKGVYGSKS